MSAGKWHHSMCLKCFRKRWPKRKIWPHEIPEDMRVWQQCCFCGTRHKDGIRMRRNPRNRELWCGVLPLVQS